MVDDPRGWLHYIPENLGRVSPLYAQFAQGLADDPEIGTLLDLIDPDQPLLVLLFSAVNFLLLKQPQHQLARFYPVLQESPRPATDAYSAFRAFCLEHQDALRALLPQARLQTNEVTRCANLLPAFALIAQREEDRPLALIEIGCSLGLNLNWHRYGYTYHTPAGTRCLGRATSPVQIQCTLPSKLLPPLPPLLPPVAQRVGIELAPLSLDREEDVRWLRACIWPEEADRYRLLDAAIALARRKPPQVVAGDAVEVLPELLGVVPRHQALCLWHSYALLQGPAQVREQIERMIAEASETRTIYRLGLEADPARDGLPRMELETYRGGERCHWEWLATCDFHGQTMEWLAPWCSVA